MRWWDKLKIDPTNLNEHSANLKRMADGSIFVRLESASPVESHKGYDELAAKLPELLAGGPEVREPLGKFLTECCVYEPRDDNLGLLFGGLTDLIPEAEGTYPAKDQGEQATQAAFCQRVVCAAIIHPEMTPERRETLASKVNLRLAASVKEDAEAEELKNQVAKFIAEQCYHKMTLTAKDSIEQALVIRKVLMEQFPPVALAADFRNQEDVQLLEIGLSRGGELWPKLAEIFKGCAESDHPDIGRRLIDLYEKTTDDGLGFENGTAVSRQVESRRRLQVVAHRQGGSDPQKNGSSSRRGQNFTGGARGPLPESAREESAVAAQAGRETADHVVARRRAPGSRLRVGFHIVQQGGRRTGAVRSTPRQRLRARTPEAG